ncbi:MAG: site-2 protease family protein [Opitutales bacterium]
MQLQEAVIVYLFLVISLSLHGWAQAWWATQRGDQTARMDGRLTLNPVAHWDPLGMAFFPILLLGLHVMAGQGAGLIFGWCRPPSMDTSQFNKPARDEILSSLAGPFSNLLVCFAVSFVSGFLLPWVPRLDELVVPVLLVNLSLFVLHILPIPPLAGGPMLRHLARMSDEAYLNLSRWGFLIFIVVVNVPPTRRILYGLLFMLYNLCARLQEFTLSIVT